MKCHACHTYIPEGLRKELICPNCGKDLSMSTQAPATIQEIKPRIVQQVKPKQNAFAPFFTIKLFLVFGFRSFEGAPTQGSISFGPTGFSLVYENGKQFKKILYRDLSLCRVENDCLVFDANGIESKIIIYHKWLPRFLSSPRRTRARVLLSLIDRVKFGLTSSEITDFQKRLG